VSVRTYVAPYHEFAAEAASRFEAPQLAVAFNSGIHEGLALWAPTLRHLAAARVPTALTAYSAWEAEQDAEVLRRCVQEVARHEEDAADGKEERSMKVSVEANPWNGLRPYLDPRASLGVFRMNDAVIWLTS
jgi:splicing suppressor protein 51